jgi:glycine cleavage system regulatory protein
MATLLVLTAIGEDRPGLVEILSRTVESHGGNWLESRMSRLANRFAGILLVSVPEPAAESLKRALQALDSEGLKVTVEVSGTDAAAGPLRIVRLELVGQDRPGIIRQVSEALARHGISIGELVTGVESASWSGETHCRIRADLRLPAEVDIDRLRGGLEALANELMVDIAFDESAGP